MKKFLFSIIVILLFKSVACYAIDVVEFDDDVQRHRYQQLTFELRCPKCQNQNLADSNSQISQDLRAQVVRLIKEGKSDQEIKDFMVSRYGDFVLYLPPVQNNTMVLWLSPLVMLLVGCCVLAVIVVRRSKIAQNELVEESEISSEIDLPGQNESKISAFDDGSTNANH
ncbi:MAG: cytochrome c-type biogenesis protein CcmH [Lentisphaeria bacterium]